MIKASFFLFLALVLAMILTKSIWCAPFIALFAAFAIRDVLRGMTPPRAQVELEVDDEDQHLAERLAQFRKALHD